MYKFRKKSPARNVKYEKSFFEDGDLQIYLVSEQIKRLDMSLAEYIKLFPFTDEQFQRFIHIAEECHFDKMKAFLIEERKQRFVSNL